MRSCSAIAAHRCQRTTPPQPRVATRCAGGAGLAPPTAHPTPPPLIGGCAVCAVRRWGRAHRACAPCAVPCAVAGPTDQSGWSFSQDHSERLWRYAEWMTVRDMLTALQMLPRDAELLAFEAGCEDYCEREVDEVEWQGGRVYLHLGVRRDDPPRG